MTYQSNAGTNVTATSIPPVTTTFATPTVYPGCQRGTPDGGFAHYFVEGRGEAGVNTEVPLLYCRSCGQVRHLRYEP